MEDAGFRFQQLVEIMARLRAPGGCPWDREQTFDSIRKYTLEETYEVLDAVDRRDWSDLRDELGDFLLQAVFFAEMAAEEGHFNISDSIEAINQKLIRRHPHIFASETAATGDEVKKRWDEIKAEERKLKAGAPQGLLDTVPRALPALVEAQQITSRAAGVGFEWESADQVLEKVNEELSEFRQAASHDELENELGDLLFTLVNLARFVKVDPEQALRRTNAKFRQRFGHIERRLEEKGKRLQGTPIHELEALWQEAKQ